MHLIFSRSDELAKRELVGGWGMGHYHLERGGWSGCLSGVWLG